MDFNILYNRPIDDFVSNVPDRKRTARERVDNQADYFRGGMPTANSVGQYQEQQGQPDYIGQAVSNTGRIVDSALPEIKGLTPEDRERRTALALEAEQLRQPVRRQSSGSFNPNNPFSLDTRGLSGAVSSAFADRKESQNQERLGEIYPELAEKDRTQRRADTREDARTSATSNILYNEYQDARGEDRFEDRLNKKWEREDFVTGEANKFRLELQDKILGQQKELAEFKNKLAGDPNSPQNRQIYISANNSYIRLLTGQIDFHKQERGYLLQQKARDDGYLSPEDTARLAEIETESEKLRIEGMRAWRQMGVISGFTMDEGNPFDDKDDGGATQGQPERTGFPFRNPEQLDTQPGTTPTTGAPTNQVAPPATTSQPEQTGFNSPEERTQAREKAQELGSVISSGEFTENDVEQWVSLLEREWQSHYRDNPEMRDNHEAMEQAIFNRLNNLIPEIADPEGLEGSGSEDQSKVSINEGSVVQGLSNLASQGIDSWRKKRDENQERLTQRSTDRGIKSPSIPDRWK